jgi:hypothetical protein
MIMLIRLNNINYTVHKILINSDPSVSNTEKNEPAENFIKI